MLENVACVGGTITENVFVDGLAGDDRAVALQALGQPAVANEFVVFGTGLCSRALYLFANMVDSAPRVSERPWIRADIIHLARRLSVAGPRHRRCGQQAPSTYASKVWPQRCRRRRRRAKAAV